MNLQEQTNRIKQMMGVISEHYSKKSEGHQKLVDMVLFLPLSVMIIFILQQIHPVI